MNAPEVRRLLGYISAGFDNRVLSDATATVWAEELEDVSFDVAKEAVRTHYRKPAPRGYLSLDVLLEQIRVLTRQTPSAIAADVRSAKARGLLDASWPERKPLTHEVAERLAEARARFAAEVTALEAAEVRSPYVIDVGTVGKEVPKS